MVLGIVATVLVGFILNFAVTNNKSAEQDSDSGPAPSEPELICRADGQFVAGFMSPQVDDADTDAMLERMNTDAVTFGGRIVPATEDDYPKEVVEAVGERQLYEYSVPMNWQGLDLESSDTIVAVGDTEYGIIQAGNDSVVITESVNGGDAFHSLRRVSEERGNNAYIGLPVPQMRTTGAKIIYGLFRLSLLCSTAVSLVLFVVALILHFFFGGAFFPTWLLLVPLAH